MLDMTLSDQTKPPLNIWNCRGCGVVHLSLGGVGVNLDQEEFRRFTESVLRIYCYEGFGDGIEIDRTLGEGIDIRRAVLTSSEIH